MPMEHIFYLFFILLKLFSFSQEDNCGFSCSNDPFLNKMVQRLQLCE